MGDAGGAVVWTGVSCDCDNRYLRGRKKVSKIREGSLQVHEGGETACGSYSWEGIDRSIG